MTEPSLRKAVFPCFPMCTLYRMCLGEIVEKSRVLDGFSVCFYSLVLRRECPDWFRSALSLISSPQAGPWKHPPCPLAGRFDLHPWQFLRLERRGKSKQPHPQPAVLYLYLSTSNFRVNYRCLSPKCVFIWFISCYQVCGYVSVGLTSIMWFYVHVVLCSKYCNFFWDEEQNLYIVCM